MQRHTARLVLLALALHLPACGGGGAEPSRGAFARLIEHAGSSHGAAQLADGSIVVLAEPANDTPEMLLRDAAGGGDPTLLGSDATMVCVAPDSTVRWAQPQASGPDLHIPVIERRAGGGFAVSGIAPGRVSLGAGSRTPANGLDLIYRAAWADDGTPLSLVSAGTGAEALGGGSRHDPSDAGAIDVFESQGTVHLPGPVRVSGNGRNRVVIAHRGADESLTWVCEITNPSGIVEAGRHGVLANGDLVLPVRVHGAAAALYKDDELVTALGTGFHMVHLSAAASVVRVHRPGIVHGVGRIERHGTGYVASGSQQGATTWPTARGTTTLGAASDSGTFLARFDAQGTMLWGRYHSSRTQGRVSYDHLSEGPGGTLLATGTTKGSPTTLEGGDNPDQTIVSPDGNYIDGLVSAYDAAGNLIWVRTFQGPGLVAAQSAFALPGGRVFVHGVTEGGAVSVAGESLPTLAPADGNAAVFMVHLSAIPSLGGR